MVYTLYLYRRYAAQAESVKNVVRAVKGTSTGKVREDPLKGDKCAPPPEYKVYGIKYKVSNIRYKVPEDPLRGVTCASIPSTLHLLHTRTRTLARSRAHAGAFTRASTHARAQARTHARTNAPHIAYARAPAAPRNKYRGVSNAASGWDRFGAAWLV